MGERTQDRRVRKTRKLLRQSLFQLMEHKRVQDITVREITELSDLNRGTFYIHYKDVFDMMEQIEQELVEDFNRVFENFTPNIEHNDPLPLFIELFRYLQENADVGRVLLGPHGDIAFINRETERLNSIQITLAAHFPAPDKPDFLMIQGVKIAHAGLRHFVSVADHLITAGIQKIQANIHDIFKVRGEAVQLRRVESSQDDETIRTAF